MNDRSEGGVDERLVVALVRGVHGLHGAVRAEVLTDHPEDRFVAGAVLYREGDDRPLTIASADAIVDGPGWRIRFREVPTRDAADALRGAYLEALVRPDDHLERGTYYWHEVVGATVRGIDGTDLGTVRDIYRVGETEVYTVAGGPFGSFDLPAVRAFIRIFAPRRGEIVVDGDALDLRAPRSHEPDPDRPKAPRRRSRRRPTDEAGESGPAEPATRAEAATEGVAATEAERALATDVATATEADPGSSRDGTANTTP